MPRGNGAGVFAGAGFAAPPGGHGVLLPRTSRIMQFHHGYQSELMTDLFGALYDPELVPTICLRDNKAGSLHGTVTNIQRNNLAARRGTGLTFAKIREDVRDEMKTAGASPDEIARFLTLADHAVATTVVPKLKPGDMWKLGGLRPGQP